ncbi:MAG: Gp138 family membrane-puncturing spike protein, partial [Fusobacteriaceae bacterium]
MAITQYATVDLLKIKTSELLSNMETMFVGFVTSVDGVNMKYSVQPTLKATEASGEIMDRAILFECPMMTMKCKNFYIRAPYQIGDMVYVGVSKEAIDEAIISSSSRKNRLEGLQNFRMIDGIILGGVLSDEEPRLSSSNTEDLILENRGNGDRIVMTKSGGLELYT